MMIAASTNAAVCFEFITAQIIPYHADTHRPAIMQSVRLFLFLLLLDELMVFHSAQYRGQKKVK